MATPVRKSESSTERPNATLQALCWQVNARSHFWSPPTDVFETETGFVVRVEIAGMSRSDFSITVEKNGLFISGVRCESPERRAYLQMEIRFGEFSVAVELPRGVDGSKAEAEYEDGFLTVVLPLAKSTEISIKG